MAKWIATSLLSAGVLASQFFTGPQALAQDSSSQDPVTQDPATRDPIAKLQADAIESGKAEFGHWGPNGEKYSSWTTHSNRLVPAYIFGGNFKSVAGENSVYRDADKLEKLYQQMPTETLNPAAEYFDQTDIYRLQNDAVASGKKRIILFVFDGMDWQTTQAAAIAKSGKVAYESGRGTGLAFQDYDGAETDFGYFVSSPHNNGTGVDVNTQTVKTPGGTKPGGYDPTRGGNTPWAAFPDKQYPIGVGAAAHAYTDSASSATSMTAGIKTYNNAINRDFTGREVLPLGRTLQEQGFAVGIVTSVPVSHATPACGYASNVHRNDYQDITRDLLGLPSISHPGGLPGVDVLLGAGFGQVKESDGSQGENFEPGNKYLAPSDLKKLENDDKYIVAQRTDGVSGRKALNQASRSAIKTGKKLFGFFGAQGGHLPYQTANGDYKPVKSVGNPAAAAAEVYSRADVRENPTLSQMTTTALKTLGSRGKPFWLMVEAGDVDWANHSNNIDNSIGALLSGEMAFQSAVDWIEANGGWNDTLLILTADHGHYLVLDKPEALAR